MTFGDGAAVAGNDGAHGHFARRGGARGKTQRRRHPAWSWGDPQACAAAACGCAGIRSNVTDTPSLARSDLHAVALGVASASTASASGFWINR